uniref:Outer membrane transport energization protein ExbB n=1 Tax=Candidatus Kentrum sp. DK TaxID=2126562 RepID=A0A450T7T2_9GAMM|nr:MAG: outer membrane transport energization protein ExbB [Candidatus Kentron sp. DK]
MEFLKHNLDFMVFGTLGFMSFLMIWFVIERYLYFSRVNLNEFTDPDELQVALSYRLTALSTIGANAPYIGLLGTVLGILITFHDLGQGGRIEPAAIMLGLALALKATAGGLVVALPAIFFYNALLRRIEVLMARWKRERR